MSAEDDAYKVLAHRFGCSPAYIKSVLEAHFETPSAAGWEHMTPARAISPEEPAAQGGKYTIEEVRDMLLHLERLRAKGVLPPLQRTVVMDAVKKDKHGKYYIATEEQLQEELRMQSRASIDPDGNLVVDGKIVKYRWLQSFSK